MKRDANETAAWCPCAGPLPLDWLILGDALGMAQCFRPAAGPPPATFQDVEAGVFRLLLRPGVSQRLGLRKVSSGS